MTTDGEVAGGSPTVKRDPTDELHYLGCDIETTGSEFKFEHKTIQIGVYDPKTQTLFREYVGWNEGTFEMEPEATAVHKIPREMILAARPASEVDTMLLNWLVSRGVRAKRGIIVGFNVGVFDMPFVRRDLPTASRHISYRCVDLNAILMSMAVATGVSWLKLKEKAKAYARSVLATEMPDLTQHDAGYDAREAILCWQWCVAQLRVGGHP